MPSRMPLSRLRASARSQPSRAAEVPRQVRLAALALGATAVTAVVCLGLMFAGLSRAGTVNDYLNGGMGWLALALAVAVRRHDRSGRRGDVATLAAAVGALLLTWGSWLVITESTGYVRAGLVSTQGLSAIGLGLVLAHQGPGSDGVLARAPATLGLVTGALLALGAFALPGALQGIDDLAAAPWHVHVGQAAAWLGAYVLLPVWCLRLARRRPTEAIESGRGATV